MNLNFTILCYISVNILSIIAAFAKMYLKNKEASVEDTRVDENCTKLTTLEELVGLLKEEVVGIQHHHPIVVYQAPCV